MSLKGSQLSVLMQSLFFLPLNIQLHQHGTQVQASECAQGKSAQAQTPGSPNLQLAWHWKFMSSVTTVLHCHCFFYTHLLLTGFSSFPLSLAGFEIQAIVLQVLTRWHFILCHEQCLELGHAWHSHAQITIYFSEQQKSPWVSFLHTTLGVKWAIFQY